MEVREGSGIEHWSDRRDEKGRMGSLKGRDKVEGEGFGLRQRQTAKLSAIKPRRALLEMLSC